MSATTFDGTTWDLSLADRLLVEAKRWGSRLRFAVMLLFHRAHGRFPRGPAEVDEGAVAELARTLGVPPPLTGALLPERCRPHGRAAARRNPRLAGLPGGNGRRRRVGVDLAQEPDLALPPVVGHRDGVSGFRHVQTHEGFAVLVHGSSPALRRDPPSASDPHRSRSVRRVPSIGTDIRSYSTEAVPRSMAEAVEAGERILEAMGAGEAAEALCRYKLHHLREAHERATGTKMECPGWLADG